MLVLNSYRRSRISNPFCTPDHEFPTSHIGCDSSNSIYPPLADPFRPQKTLDVRLTSYNCDIVGPTCASPDTKCSYQGTTSVQHRMCLVSCRQHNKISDDHTFSRPWSIRFRLTSLRILRSALHTSASSPNVALSR